TASDGGPTANASKEKPAAAPAMGNPMGMLGTMLAAQSDEPGPYDEPRASAKYDEDDPHAAVIEIDESIIELKSLSLFGGGGGIELRALLQELRALVRDQHVTALVLRFGAGDLDFPAAEELRAALTAFKSSGEKPRQV